jgi:hypothetical protein
MWKHFSTQEHLKISSELELHGKFFEQATTRVQAVIKTLLEPEYREDLDMKTLPMLPNDLSCGAAKSVYDDQRKPKEPDVVFAIPSTGPTMRDCVIGEVKSCSTCSIQDMWGDFENMGDNSARNLFGKYQSFLHLQGNYNG